MTAIDEIAAHLNTLGLNFRQVDADTIETGFTGQNVAYNVLLLDRDSLLSAMVLRLAVVPERCLPEMLRLLNRINALCMRWGGFWVHPEERWVAFSLAAPLIPPISQELVQQALSALDATDYFFPALAAVLWQGASADEALDTLADATRGGGDTSSPDDPGLDIAI